MKRNISLGISMLLLVLLLAACGSAGNSSESAEAPASSEEEATGESSAATRLYKHAMGETEIPAHPERIITLQYVSQMLSVGVKPIGALDYLLETKDPAFEGIEELAAPRQSITR